MGGSFEHVGCYLDKKGDRVLSDLIADAAMTPLVSGTGHEMTFAPGNRG